MQRFPDGSRPWSIDQPVMPRELPVELLSKEQLAEELQRVQQRRAADAAYEAELICGMADLTPDDTDPDPDSPGGRRGGWAPDTELPGVSEFFTAELAVVLNCGRGTAAVRARRAWTFRESLPATGATIILTITAALDALAGNSAAPGSVNGLPITAGHLRELLTRIGALGLTQPDNGSLTFALTDDDGELLTTLTLAQLQKLARRGCPDHPGSDCECAVADRPPDTGGYEPTGVQRVFVKTRDRRCRFPNCGQRVGWADLDHVVPHGLRRGDRLRAPLLPVPQPPPVEDLRPGLAVHHGRRRHPARHHTQRRHPHHPTTGPDRPRAHHRRGPLHPRAGTRLRRRDGAARGVPAATTRNAGRRPTAVLRIARRHVDESTWEPLDRSPRRPVRARRSDTSRDRPPSPAHRSATCSSAARASTRCSSPGDFGYVPAGFAHAYEIEEAARIMRTLSGGFE